jgi:hypothetical protein
MTRFSLFFAFLILVGACSSRDDAVLTTDIAPAADIGTTSTTVTTAEDTSTTRDSMGDSGASLVPNATIAPEGPAAPDFTIALGDGGSFTLSEEAKPVYMIFWAEW